MKLVRPFIFLACFVLALILAFSFRGEQPVVLRGNVSSGEQVVISLTPAVVQEHSLESDCWTVIEGKVYDITSYVPFHPGGRAEIMSVCGVDGTGLFTGVDPQGRRHSQNAHTLLANYYVGDIGSSVLDTPNTPVVPAAHSFEDAIFEAYPGARIVKVHVEDEGRVEGTFFFDGDKYEFKADAQGNLLGVERD